MHGRKILMGALVGALPLGAIAATQSVASAATPQHPVTCTGFTGTVHFGTPLTTAGVATSSKVAEGETVTGASGTCGGHALTVPGGITITGAKNTKLAKTDARYNKTNGTKYLTGSWAQFEGSASGLQKALKVINFNIGGQAATFKTKSANIVAGGACGAGVGFKLSGQVKSGAYADKTATVLACLTSDAGGTATGNFGADVGAAQGVTSATIGGGSSAVL